MTNIDPKESICTRCGLPAIGKNESGICFHCGISPTRRTEHSLYSNDSDIEDIQYGPFFYALVGVGLILFVLTVLGVL